MDAKTTTSGAEAQHKSTAPSPPGTATVDTENATSVCLVGDVEDSVLLPQRKSPPTCHHYGRHILLTIIVAFAAILAVVLIVVTAKNNSIAPLDSSTLSAELHEFDMVPFFRLPRCENMKVVGMWITVKKELPLGIVAQRVVSGDGQSDGVWSNTTRVAVFRSVPFATPPVGNWRLRSPQDLICPNPSNVTWNASDEKPRCLQSGWSHPTSGSEDCLYLTIHVPEKILRGAVFSSATPKAAGPMLTYIYGGSLVSGYSNGEPLGFFSANTPPPQAYGSSTILENEFVVVSPNYRLGGLGWLAIDAMEEEITANVRLSSRSKTMMAGNFGLQDQLSALRWAKLHIANVGGDPNQNTIMGQSSGGTSVLALMQTSASEGLFRAAISLSGSPNITMDKTTKYAQDEPYAAALGCPINKADQERNRTFAALNQMNCLRQLTSADDFVTLLPENWNNPGMWNLQSLNHSTPNPLQLAGLVFVDGELIKQSLEETMLTGATNPNVTLMIGNMGQEMDVFYAWPPHQPYVVNYTLPQWKTFLSDDVFESWGPGDSKTMAETIDSFYGDQAAQVNPRFADWSILTDYSISCAAPWLAMKGANSAGGKRTQVQSSGGGGIYTFLNNWPPTHPNKTDVWGSSSYHLWDYLCAIQDWTRYSGENIPAGPYTPSATDLELSRLLRAHWGALVWNGTLADSEQDWPEAVSRGTSTTSRPDYFTYVYSTAGRFPFKASGAIKNYLKEECNFFRENGIAEPYWWVN